MVCRAGVVVGGVEEGAEKVMRVLSEAYQIYVSCVFCPQTVVVEKGGTVKVIYN